MTERDEALRLLAELLLVELLEQRERDECAQDPKKLLARMSAVDERQASEFRFLNEPGWEWQGEFFDWLHSEQRCIALKARQLGVTWLGCAYVVWTLLYKRGSLCLVYRQKEEEAHENVGRCWDLLNSLPAHLLNGAVVEKPDRGARASGEIRLRFPDGKRSRVLAMTSASASGHGKTAAVVLLDEHSRIERAAEISKAVAPAAGEHGKIIIISTANGVSNPETGEGNHFHWMWANADESGYSKRFLPWSLHPGRNDEWYAKSPEVRELKPHERAEQYPANEHEAFRLTSNNFFDDDDISYYGNFVPKDVWRGEFVAEDSRNARLKRRKDGPLRVYVMPNPAHKYAIGADPAQGTGRDYSAAAVIDLATMELVAEFYSKTISVDLFAFQLHYLGKWYGKSSGCGADAKIAVETGGGPGHAVIAPLRDGREGRKPYGNLYRHRQWSKPRIDEHKSYGWPTNSNTRPGLVNQIERVVRERSLPWMPPILIGEAATFLRGPLPGRPDTGTWPRAQDGTHDDMVFASAIALEMYRNFGEWPERHRHKRKRREWSDDVVPVPLS